MSDGLDRFSGRDLPIPELEMLQPTSKDVAGLTDVKTGEQVDSAAGLFIDRKNKQAYGKKFSVVVLKVDRTRTFWFSDSRDPNDKDKKGRKCWSDDGGVTPSAKVQNPMAAHCSVCPQAKYDLEILMLLLDVERSLELNEPVLFKWKSKKKLNEQTLTLIDSIKKRKKPLRDFQLTMSSLKTSNSQGNFCVVSFSGINLVESEQLQGLIEQAFIEHCETGIDSDAGEEQEQAQESTPGKF